MDVFAANRAERPTDVGTQLNFAIAAFAILTKRFTDKIYLVSTGVSRRYRKIRRLAHSSPVLYDTLS
jgi:hypothetical protein